MAEQLRIDVAHLRRAAMLALDHLEETAGETVLLDVDYFWSIPADAKYSIDVEPTELTIGQLSDSWQHLVDLLGDESRVHSFHLVWLAEVLKAVGRDVVQ